MATKGDKAGGRGAPANRLECWRKHWERAIALVMSVAMEMKGTCPAGWRCTLFRRIRSSKSILNYVMSSTVSGGVVGEDFDFSKRKPSVRERS